jgi:hypothetical protein
VYVDSMPDTVSLSVWLKAHSKSCRLKYSSSVYWLSLNRA